MTNISNETVKAFVNDVVRPFADRIAGMRGTGNLQIPFYTQQVAPLLEGHDDTDLILDGSENDGRVTLTKGDLVGIMTLLQGFSGTLDGAGVMDLIMKAAVNPKM